MVWRFLLFDQILIWVKIFLNRSKKDKKRERDTNNERRERERSTSKKKSSKEKEGKEKSDKRASTLKVSYVWPSNKQNEEVLVEPILKFLFFFFFLFLLSFFSCFPYQIITISVWLLPVKTYSWCVSGPVSYVSIFELHWT